MRLLIGEGQSAAVALAVLSGTITDPRHEAWPDDISYADVRLVTFDRGKAKLHGDAVQLIQDRSSTSC